MARTKKQKVELLESYKNKLKKAKGIVVIKPSKLTPTEVSEFRKELFALNTSLNVVKNSVLRLALKETNNPELDTLQFGEHAVLFLGEDLVTPSKALKKFAEGAKTKEGDAKINIVAGILEGAVLTKEQVIALAEMPDKKGSVSMILGILDNALSSIINVMEDPVRSYLSIIDQSFKS